MHSAKRMLILTLLYGFLASCAGLLLQTAVLIGMGPAATAGNPSLTFLYTAACIEEGMKLLFLIQAARRSDHALIFFPSVSFGFGFALVEIALASLLPEIGASIGDSWRALTLNTLLHILTTLLLAFGIRHFRFPSFGILMSLIGALVLHISYNVSRLLW